MVHNTLATHACILYGPQMCSTIDMHSDYVEVIIENSILQIAELLRGYTNADNNNSTSIGAGAIFHLSETAWRIRILQTWLLGFLTRTMSLGHGHGRLTTIVFNTYSVSNAGQQFLDSESLPSVALPPVVGSSTSTPITKDDAQPNTKLLRKTKGTHLLPILTKLLASSENWYDIKEQDDYQYPGKFSEDNPRRLGYASDISSLPFYTREDEHFLFNDIQVSKGKLRAPRMITTIVDGKEEEVNYRIAPCGGVKCCPVEGCSYCVPNWKHQPCPQHSEASLVSSGECPVEFVYVWPTHSEDKRRWLSGIVRRDYMKASNLHSHPLHAPTKVPIKVVQDIQHALKMDPSLKTHDIMTGMKK